MDAWVKEVTTNWAKSIPTTNKDAHLDRLTALRLLPPREAYLLVTYVLTSNWDSFTMAERLDLLQILSEVTSGFNLFVYGLFRRDPPILDYSKLCLWIHRLLGTDVMLSREVPKHTEIYQQQKWLSDKYDLTKIMDEGFAACNPSTSGDYVCIRTVNYRIAQHPFRYQSWDPKTKEYAEKFTGCRTENFVGIAPRFVRLAKPCVPYTSHIAGLEDVRIFKWKDNEQHRLGAIAVSTELTSTREPKTCLMEIEPETGRIVHFVPLLNAGGQFGMETKPQKNWLPFIMNSILYFLYSYCPYIVLEYDEKQRNCKLATFRLPVEPNCWRGSAGPVFLPAPHNLWIALVHEVKHPHYAHRWIASPNWLTEGVTRVSPLFVFHSLGIEIPCGLTLLRGEDQVRVSYGLDDREARYMDIPISQVLTRLAPFPSTTT